LRWLFEAKRRFALSVLNYMVTCNHIHLLVKDTGGDVIAKSMQLIAGWGGVRDVGSLFALKKLYNGKNSEVLPAIFIDNG
jgi:hypothetical protein